MIMTIDVPLSSVGTILPSIIEEETKKLRLNKPLFQNVCPAITVTKKL